MSDKTISVDLLADDKMSPALERAGEKLDSLGRAVDDLSGKTAEIDVDAQTEGASAKLAELGREVRSLDQAKAMQIDADITQARIKLGELRAKRDEAAGDARIRMDADVASAEAKLAMLEARKREVAQDKRSRIDVDTSGGITRVQALGVAIAALIPIAIAATGALAGIGAVGAVGLGAAALAFGGLSGAVSELGKSAGAAGGAVASNASAIRSATRSVEQAERDLVQAKRDVVSAERDVTDAMHGAEEAKYSAAQASRAVGDAERTLAQAQREEQRAQEDLTRAREDASTQLRDLQIQTEDMALAQKDAALAVSEAQARAAKVAGDPQGTELERQRANLAVEQAIQRQKDLGIQAQDLAAKKAAADKAGVDGAAQVVAAQDRVSQASQRTAAATQGVADARHREQQAAWDAAQAQRQIVDAQQRVKDAQDKVTLSAQRVADAQIALKEAAQQAGAGGAGGMSALAAAMAGLSPAGRSFAVFMRGFIDGPVKELRWAAQEGMLPPLQRGFQALVPVMASLHEPLQRFTGLLGTGMASVLQTIGQLAKPMLEFATASLQGLAPLQGILAGFSRQLTVVLGQLVSSGAARGAMQALSQVIGALLPLLPQLISFGARMMVALGPALAGVIRALSQGIVALLPALLQLAPSFGQLLVSVAQLLPTLVSLAVQLTPVLVAVVGVLASPAFRDFVLILGGIIVAWRAFILVVQAVRIAQLALNLAMAMNPIGLVVIAIAALVAALVIAYRNSETFRTIVHTAMTAVGTAFTWLKTTGATALQWLGDKWNGLMGFIRDAPGKITGWAKGMWDGIKNSFKTAINWIISGWNKLHFSIPGFSFAGVSVAGFNLGLPQIPYLAKGGVVTQPTLAVVGEAGPEAVMPLSVLGPNLGRGGGSITVNVTNAVVGNELQIARVVTDALTRAKLGGAGFGVALAGR